ncbi:MAG TPA: cupin domain-containing protein [Rubrobacter sp.]|nr:cupin domain-containing protein [Rubrobacter sp.]
MHTVDPAQAEASPGTPDYFTGQVTLWRMVATDPPTNVKMLRVEFAPGARTHWHRHSGVQVLVVLSGRCRFQHENGAVREAETGEVIHILAGEKHWHGAASDGPMVHLAINIDTETDWLEPVTDAQYEKPF